MNTIKNNQKGFTLYEVLIALLLFSLLMVAFVSAWGVASRITVLSDEKESIRNYLSSEIEYVMNSSYNGTYTPELIPAYAGYFSNTSIQTETINPGEQKITVIVQSTVSGKITYVLEGYKTK